MSASAAASTVPFVDLGAQYRSIEAEVGAAIGEVLKATAYILGPSVGAFEGAFAKWVGATHAIGVADGTSAITLALKAAGTRPGDEVITAANTYVATAEAIVHAGAVPVLVDCDPVCYTIDPSKIEARITKRTRAIIPVHLYGQLADMGPIMEIAARRGLTVVEDCAQAHGAKLHGRGAGTFGVAASWSFYPGKNLGAYGDAGGVTTSVDAVADAIRKYRNHGGVVKYEHDVVGWNSRLDGVQAAVLKVKLAHIDRWNAERRRAAADYHERLARTLEVIRPVARDGAEHVWHLYVIQVPDAAARDALARHLGERGIQSGIHYPRPVHRTQAFASLGEGDGAHPVSEGLASRILSLPMFPELTTEQIDRVAAAVEEFFARGRKS